MSAATGAAPTARTRPRFLIAVVVLGAAAALGIRVLGGGSDGPTTVGQLAAPVGGDEVTIDTPAVPAVTVPAAATSTTADPTGTVPGAALPTIPWTTGADGTRREPFTFVPEVTEPTDVAAAAAGTSSDDTGVAVSQATVSVPTVVGTPIGTGVTDTTHNTDTGTDTSDTATTTTVPGETTTTRSPTLGLVTRPSGGYWLFQADGSVFASRADTWFGDLRAVTLTSPVVGMQATATGKGYLLVSRDGGVFAFGDATYDGSIPETLARQLESLLDDGYLAPTTTTTTTPKRREADVRP